MWISQWSPDDQAFIVTSQHGDIWRVCHCFAHAIDACVDAGAYRSDGQWEWQNTILRLRARTHMRQRIEYLQYLRAWRTDA